MSESENSQHGAKTPISGLFTPVYEAIESRIKHFESIYHTYEANELRKALRTVQRLMQPIMFEKRKNGNSDLS